MAITHGVEESWVPGNITLFVHNKDEVSSKYKPLRIQDNPLAGIFVYCGAI